MYKPSRYNLKKENSQGELVIINTLTTKSLKVGGQRREKIEQILNHDNIGWLELAEEESLISDGFVVDINTDEYKLATSKYLDVIYGNEILEFTIIVTDGCNFQCIYCYQEERVNKYIQDDVLTGILSYINKYGNNFKKIKIDWFGGEPLLAKDKIIHFMKECKEICKKINRPLLSFMSTNGYELNLDTFKELQENNIYFYQVTLDGNSKTHNIFRPHKNKNDSYETILSNLKEINREVKSFYRITVRINLNKTMLTTLERFLKDLDFMRDNRKFDINCQKMNNYGGEGIKALNEEIISDDELSEVIQKFNLESFHLLKHTFYDFASGVCSAGRKNSFYVLQDGELQKCSLAIYDKDFVKDNIVGRISKGGEMKLKAENEAKWIIRDEVDSACKECIYYPICCNHYCPYRRLKNNIKICYKYKQQLFYS